MISQVESQFQINSGPCQNGFLPNLPPLCILPSKYEVLEHILQEMPVVKKNGEPGLLGKNILGQSILKLPLLDISSETDSQIVTALFRDYSFLTSAYIFEPIYHNLIEENGSRLARRSVPTNLAVPLKILAKRLGIHPFLDYAHSYILYNWKMKSPDGGLELDNLELIRSFTGLKSEDGFVLVTAALNRYSKPLVQNAIIFLKSVEEKDGGKCKLALESLLDTMTKIYMAMGKMWTHSNTTDFKFIRTFISGTTDKSIFPNGLVYKDQDGDTSEEPKFYRGVSAAADSIIPLMDAILELTPEMEDNEVTKMLQDFRNYRPKSHQEFLDWVEKRSKELYSKSFASQTNPILFLQILDQVRQFRTRHWRFIKLYIIRYTNGNGAIGSGGGSLNLLPNLQTVLKEMDKVMEIIPKVSLSEYEKNIFDKLLEIVKEQMMDVDTEMKKIM